jgi:hypothetical protein
MAGGTVILRRLIPNTKGGGLIFYGGGKQEGSGEYPADLKGFMSKYDELQQLQIEYELLLDTPDADYLALALEYQSRVKQILNDDVTNCPKR